MLQSAVGDDLVCTAPVGVRVLELVECMAESGVATLAFGAGAAVTGWSAQGPVVVPPGFWPAAVLDLVVEIFGLVCLFMFCISFFELMEQNGILPCGIKLEECVGEGNARQAHFIWRFLRLHFCRLHSRPRTRWLCRTQV